MAKQFNSTKKLSKIKNLDDLQRCPLIQYGLFSNGSARRGKVNINTIT